LLFGITLAVALSAHRVNASPMRTRFVLTLGVTIPTVIIAAIMWTQARGQNRSPSYVADRDHVVPPAADAKRASVEREDPSPDDEDETD